MNIELEKLFDSNILMYNNEVLRQNGLTHMDVINTNELRKYCDKKQFGYMSYLNGLLLGQQLWTYKMFIHNSYNNINKIMKHK